MPATPIISPWFSFLTAARFRVRVALLAGLVLAAPGVGAAAEPTPPAAAPEEVKFMRDIAPILSARCFSCHGPKKDDAEHEEEELRLDIFEQLVTGDHPAIVPGHPEESSLFERITIDDTSERMPRDDEPLTAAEIELVRRWIKAGAKFDGPDPKVPYKVMVEPRPHPATTAKPPVAGPVAARASDAREGASSRGMRSRETKQALKPRTHARILRIGNPQLSNQSPKG